MKYKSNFIKRRLFDIIIVQICYTKHTYQCNVTVNTFYTVKTTIDFFFKLNQVTNIGGKSAYTMAKIDE